MMTGVNELRINTETMLKAINYWLDGDVFQRVYDSKTSERLVGIEAVEIIHQIDGQDGPAYIVKLSCPDDEFKAAWQAFRDNAGSGRAAK